MRWESKPCELGGRGRPFQAQGTASVKGSEEEGWFCVEGAAGRHCD